MLTGLDSIMPIKQSRVHVNKPPLPLPWVSPAFKRLINLRQQTISTGTLSFSDTTVMWSIASVKFSLATTMLQNRTT